MGYFIGIKIKKYRRIYGTIDLNSSDKRKEAAEYFIKKGRKCVEDLILEYEGFIDKGFVEKEIFAKMKLEGDLHELALKILNYQYEPKMRYGTLILIKNAKVIENDGIMKKIEDISKSDTSYENRIVAYDVLCEKLKERSLNSLLQGLMYDSHRNVRMNCIAELIELGVKNERIVENIRHILERENEEREVIEMLIEWCGELKVGEFSGRLIEFLDNQDDRLSSGAAKALTRICNGDALGLIREKCLIGHDERYRQSILEDLRNKEDITKAINLVEWYRAEYPDEEEKVLPILVDLYKRRGG
ncbi:MAG: hypothetical protein WBA22_00380 [Candidatus Methanofastidiosia archaeon]